MITFTQEQRHFLNIAVAREAQRLVLESPNPTADPATILHQEALQHFSAHRSTAAALLLTAGPNTDPPTLLDFRDNPRLPTIIDGFISQNTCHAVRRCGAVPHAAAAIAALSLARYCLHPEVAHLAGELESLPRLMAAPANLRHLLEPRRDSINLHYQSILARGNDSQEQIIIAFQPLIERLTSSNQQYGDMLPEDRHQEARAALIRAMEKFDHRLQNRFSSYASYYITTHVDRASRRQGFPIYEPESNRRRRNRALRENPDNPLAPTPTTISLEYNLSDEQRSPFARILSSMADTDPDPVACTERRDLQARVQSILDHHLDDEQRTVLSMRFGINFPRAYSQQEVARSLRVRHSTIRDIETKALENFTKAATTALADYI